MKNNLIKVLLGFAAVSVIAATPVKAQTNNLCSVGSATLIDGGITCTTSKGTVSSVVNPAVTALTSDFNVKVIPMEVEDTVAVVNNVPKIMMVEAEMKASLAAKAEAEAEAEATVSTEETTEAEAAPAEVSENSMVLGDAVEMTELSTEEATEEEETDDVETRFGYTNLGIAIVDDHLNVRETPEDGSRIVGKMTNDCGCEVLEIENGMAHIVSGSVEGYVSTDYLLTGELANEYASSKVKKVANVNTLGLKVRTAPSTEADVINMVAYGEDLEVIEDQGEWVKVLYDGQEAYVSKEFVKIGEGLKKALNIDEFLYGSAENATCVQLCEFAKQYLGRPYVWGGTDLERGSDCSGYVLTIFKRYGYSLPHSSRVQATMGTGVSVANARPGDLVFYSKGGHVNHVAIYIGGGQVIHASSPKYGVRITSVYYRTPTCVRRIIK